MTWSLVLLLPLLSAILMGFSRLRPIIVNTLMPLAALPAVLAAIFPPEPKDLPTVLFGARLGMGEFGTAFLFPTALLWTASAWFAVLHMKQDPRIARFAFFFLLTMTGNLGLITALDVPTFYACFALMTFAAYGLIVHNRTPEAKQAGRIYLVMALVGEAALITALFFAVHTAGTMAIRDMAAATAMSAHRDLIICTALIGFGVKAGAFLLHFWLPLAHPVAPAPASAVLSGCMIKAGLLGWLHFLPLGLVALHGWGTALTLFGVLALYFGVIAGLGEPRPKTILAYSSISQMGLMTISLGLGLTYAPGWPLLYPFVLLLVLNHALAKGMLFLTAGIASRTGTGKGDRGLLFTSAALPALALAGLPWSGGAAAKAGLKMHFPPADLFRALPLKPLLLLSSTGTMLLLGHYLLRLRDTLPNQEQQTDYRLWIPCLALLPFLVPAQDWIVHLSGEILLLKQTEMVEEIVGGWPVLLGVLLLLPFRMICRECVLPPRISWSTVNTHVVGAIDRALLAFDLFRPSDSLLWRFVSQKYVSWFIPDVADPDVLLRLEKRFLHWYSMALVFVLMLSVFLLVLYWEVIG